MATCSGKLFEMNCDEYSASPFPTIQVCLVPSPVLDMIHGGEYPVPGRRGRRQRQSLPWGHCRGSYGVFESCNFPYRLAYGGVLLSFLERGL